MLRATCYMLELESSIWHAICKLLLVVGYCCLLVVGSCLFCYFCCTCSCCSCCSFCGCSYSCRCKVVLLLLLLLLLLLFLTAMVPCQTRGTWVKPWACDGDIQNWRLLASSNNLWFCSTVFSNVLLSIFSQAYLLVYYSHCCLGPYRTMATVAWDPPLSFSQHCSWPQNYVHNN